MGMYMAARDTGESVKPIIAILFVTLIILYLLAKTAFFASKKKEDSTETYKTIMLYGFIGMLILHKIVNYIT